MLYSLRIVSKPERWNKNILFLNCYPHKSLLYSFLCFLQHSYHAPSEGGGDERIFGDSIGDPPPQAVLRAVGGHSVPSQGPLHTGDQEKVCLHQYGWILPVLRALDSGGSDPISDYTTAVWTGALSQWKTDPRLGLFCLNLLIKIPFFPIYYFKSLLSTFPHDCSLYA